MFSVRKTALLALCALTLFGCSSKAKLTAKGQIIKGGAPLTVPQEEYVRVTFHPIPADGSRARNTYVAVYDRSDGKFTVVGADGQGLPPGKYRVAVEHERKRQDIFEGAFDADRSPFIVEVSSSSKEFVIDLDKRS
jgi:hypothetical protein